MNAGRVDSAVPRAARPTRTDQNQWCAREFRQRCGSAMIPLGNCSSTIFGEIADAMFQALKAGMAPSERAHTLRPVVLHYAWQRDEGIGEVRGGWQSFVHSKV